MATFSLAAYTIRVKDRQSRDFVSLDSCSGGVDMLDVLRAALHEMETTPAHNQAERKLLRVRQVKRTDRTLAGVIETSECGYERDLYDATTGAKSYRRQTHDAEMIPFYFLVSIPRKRDEGILILQRFHQLGIHSLVERQCTVRTCARPKLRRDLHCHVSGDGGFTLALI